MRRVILITNTHPESDFIDYIRACISGDCYQLMPRSIRIIELQTERGKPCLRRTPFLLPNSGTA